MNCIKTGSWIVIFLMFASCSNSKLNPTVNTLEIMDNWEFSDAGSNSWFPASIPGTIHTDLLANDLILDPFFRTNEEDMQWVGYKDWSYRTTFDVNPGLLQKNHQILRFNGLDTYAKVLLNGEEILSANNMFRTWVVDVAGKIKPENNTIEIQFRNVFDENRSKWEDARFRLMAFPNNDQADTMLALYSRKAQFHYGWDWGPRLVTAGIWKSIEFESWDSYRIEDLHVYSEDVTAESATIVTNLELVSDSNRIVHTEIRLNGRRVHEAAITLSGGPQEELLKFEVKNPRLWWSNGLGKPYLYDYEVILTDENGKTDTKTLRLGIRSLEVVREKDEFGRSFFVRLNGVPVFMKGANSIPLDNFQNRVTREHYKALFEATAEVHMNMIRVWGGGIYETNDFYELADEHGVIIWQDMMFACAMYPGDSDYLQNVYQEVLDNVKRIRNHASLGMYCGNNENEIAWYQWGWKEMYSDEIQKEYEEDLHNLFYKTIPAALAKADPTRYYLPSSPIAGYDNRPNDDGDIHYWGVWHGQHPFENFNDNLARFMSEYGFQSYPERSTVEKFTFPEDRYLSSPVMLSHQRCMADNRNDREYGNRLIQTYMDRMFRTPKDFNSYLYVSQLVQAEGMRIAIEAHRRAMPYTMGTLYWQINDCWPVASWSSIDYYGNWKATHHFMRELYAPVLIAPWIDDDHLQIYIVSDKLEDLSGEMNISIWDTKTGLINKHKFDITVPQNTSTHVHTASISSLMGTLNPIETVIEIQFQDVRRLVYLVQPRDMDLPRPNVQFRVRRTSNGSEIELRTDVLAKNILLELETGVLPVSQNYFDLLPGETKRVRTSLSTNELSGLRVLTLTDTY